MSSSYSATVTVYKELDISEPFEQESDYREFKFEIPATITHSVGQTGEYGRKLEPDVADVEVTGDVIITDLETDKRMTPQFFTANYDRGDEVLEGVINDKERIREYLADKAEQEKIDDELSKGCF